MSRAPDALIIGGGIIGSACAFCLAERGMLVEVVDAGIVGGGTTAAGMGHLAVMDDSPAQFDLTSLSCRLWDQLADDLPAEAEYVRDGAIWVAETEDEAALIPAKIARYRARGVAAEMLRPRQLAELEPELRPGLAGGMLLPGDRVLYPPVVTAWFLDRVRDMGGEIISGCEVKAIEERGVYTRTGFRTAGQIVNAAGPQAARLTPELPIEPRKGHLVITDRHPGFINRQMLELGYLKSAHGGGDESVAFNVQPRVTGQVLIGSSRQMVGWDRTFDHALVSRMVERAVEFLPRLGELTAIRAWFGFRPATPDNLPLIGPWPAQRNLWIAAGHEGLGHTTALGTGLLLAQMMAGEKMPVDPQPFLPQRVLE